MLHVSILLNDNGFAVRGLNVPWSSVQAIATFKRDRLTFDDICLAFQIGPDLWVEVSQDDAGFAHLAAEVERRYPVPRDWLGAVMRPAFATNYRILWRVG